MTVAVIERTIRIQELTIPHFSVEQACGWNIAKQHAKSNRQQEQRLILFPDGEPQQEAGDADHYGILPAFTHKETGDGHIVPELRHRGSEVKVLSRCHYGHEQQRCEKANILEILFHCNCQLSIINCQLFTPFPRALVHSEPDRRQRPSQQSPCHQTQP